MTQANDFLEKHLVEGTSNQIDDVVKYLDDAEGNITLETTKNGNEVLEFSDGSILVRIDDEAFDYADIEDYA